MKAQEESGTRWWRRVVLLAPFIFSCAAIPQRTKNLDNNSAVSREVASREPPASKGDNPLGVREPEVRGGEPLRLDSASGVVASEPTPLTQSRGLQNLEPFYRSLDELRARKRKKPVRIMWLGDSHTAADFMTHRVRSHLDQSFAPGGPGFVRLGLRGYRHGAVRFQTTGKVAYSPPLPSQRTVFLDGVFGYGGILTRLRTGSRVSAELREKIEKPVTWTLSYRLPPGAQLRLRLGQRTLTLQAKEGGSKAQGGIESQAISGTGRDRFSVVQLSGAPELFGAFCEFDDVGVVLDTVGINGARTATALAWEARQFIEQVKLRRPELLVLAFGTNEVFDTTQVDEYATHTKQLIGWARKALPNLPCWVVGPPDSAKKSGGSLSRVHLVTEAQRQAAQDQACAFTSAYELMGGEGSFNQWARAHPPKARGDRIHLTVTGYRELGNMLAQALATEPP